jgi:hypothetical protein
MLYPAELRARAMFMRSFCFLPFRILLLLNGPPTRTPGSNLALAHVRHRGQVPSRLHESERSRRGRLS